MSLLLTIASSSPVYAWRYIFRDTGDSLNDSQGEVIEGVGDQNGDGYDDILVKVGRLREFRIYHGGERMDTIPDWSIHAFSGGTNIGDVNNDGIPDMFFMLFETDDEGHKLETIFYGGEADTLPDLILQFNSYAHKGGDVNGDGYDDVFQVWSGYNHPNPQWFGRIFLYLGSEDGLDTIPDHQWLGEWDREMLGSSFTSGGDLNGDGYDDFCCSSKIEGDESEYMLHIYFGGEDLDNLEVIHHDCRNNIGRYPSSTGIDIVEDLNNDSCDELKMFTQGYDGTLIFFGRENFQLTDPYYLIIGGNPVSLGDVNGDGFNDLLLKSSNACGQLGRITVYLGGRWVYNYPVLEVTGWEEDLITPIGRGECRTGCGDVNGDGFNDVMFAANGQTNGTDNSRGEVYIIGGNNRWVADVKQEPDAGLQPEGIEITEIYPNPFNDALNIEIEVYHPVDLNIDICTLAGTTVAHFSYNDLTVGSYSFNWNADGIPSGIYLVSADDGQGHRHAVKAVRVR